MLIVWLLLGTAMPAAAQDWTAAQADRAASAAANCSGGEFDTRERLAPEIAASLPKAGERAATLSEQRIHDIYMVAGGLLKPGIANPERALDPATFLKCRPDPGIGVALLAFLTADGPGRFRGPNNSYYWLGQAYRRGTGVTADPNRARFLFLTARALGIITLTAQDWGLTPAEPLATALARPDTRAMLEQAAAADRGEAQLLLAEALLPSDPNRARTLIRAAAARHHFQAVRQLADWEAKGVFGTPDLAEATRLHASVARFNGDEYRAMLDTAQRFNGGEIPDSGREVALAELGGPALLANASEAPIDHLRGRVRTRGLLGPDGRIVFTEIADPGMRGVAIGRETLNVFDPAKLKPLTPYAVNGRAVFAWVRLPPVQWK